MRFFKNTNYNFVKYGRVAFVISGTLIIASILSLIVKHGLNLSIDFAGGLRIDVKLDRPVTYDELSKIRSRLNVDEVHTVGFAEDELLIQSKGVLLAKNLADRVYRYRSSVGSIKDLSELKNIPGIEGVDFKSIEAVFTVGEVKKETTTKEVIKEKEGSLKEEETEEKKPIEKGGGETEIDLEEKGEGEKEGGGEGEITTTRTKGEKKTEGEIIEKQPVISQEKTNINAIDYNKMLERFQEIVVLDLTQKINAVLREIYPPEGIAEIDLNSLDTREILYAELIRFLPQDEVNSIVDKIAKYRNFDSPLLGVRLIPSFDKLKEITGLSDERMGFLKENFRLDKFVIRGTEMIGPRVSGELTRIALLALLYANIAMLIYIAFRFDFRSGLLAIVALVHDVIITVGFCSFFNIEMSLVVIAALLTIVGYSVNDTVVYYDRVREGLLQQRKETYAEALNRCINENLSRTMLTGLSSLIVLIVLYFKGGQALRDFAFTLIIGIILGTYSSVYIAAPLLIEWDKATSRRRGGRVRRRKI
ncbi:MAG: protein translocase subunit SecF [bacterium]